MRVKENLKGGGEDLKFSELMAYDNLTKILYVVWCFTDLYDKNLISANRTPCEKKKSSSTVKEIR